jgi:DNA-binding XRE family transcriptional regulator
MSKPKRPVLRSSEGQWGSANIVKAKRKELGMNQIEFATVLGVHPVTVSKWENRKADPSVWQLNLICALEKKGHPAAFLALWGPIKTLSILLLPKIVFRVMSRRCPGSLR